MSTESLLPDNRTVLEVSFEKTVSGLLADMGYSLPALWRANDVPADLLPWLAQAKGVGRWDTEQTESERREAVADIWPLQAESGTRAAIKRALTAAGFEAEVVPWQKMVPKGQPYELQVTGWADDKPIDEARRANVLQRVGDAVSERDVISVRLGRQSVGDSRVGAVVQLGKVVNVQPYVVGEISTDSSSRYGAAVHSLKVMNIQAVA